MSDCYIDPSVTTCTCEDQLSGFFILMLFLQVFRDILRVARCQEAQVLAIATARNKQELNRELLTSQGTHTFDRVLEI